MIYNYVGLDVETTGFNHKTDEIIEISVIEFNLDGKIGEKIHFLCYPMSGFINPGASAVNGIYIKDVEGKPNYLRDGVREKVAKFIGTRIVVGHNVIKFDIKFVKVKPRKMEDTLIMCRAVHQGRNNLKAACKRYGLGWNDEDAHRAEYDVEQTIKLFCKIKSDQNKKTEVSAQLPLFGNLEEVTEDVLNKITGVVPTKEDKNMMTTQAYSFSRIKLFDTCPFKWYMSYIKKIKEPNKSYFMTGKICHSVAEWAGEWCYRRLFANKFRSYNSIMKDISIPLPEGHTGHNEPGLYLFDNPDKLKEILGVGRGALMNSMDEVIPLDSYEKVSMPDWPTYEDLIEKAINRHRCNDPDVIIESKKIMSRFFEIKDFSLMPGEVMLTEKRLAFDKDWKVIPDFYSNKAFFRGIIDLIEYLSDGDYLIITDYKSSRTMLTEKQIKEDRQMQVYLLLIYMFIPRESYKRVILRIEYIRFGKIVEYEVTDVEDSINKTLQWINDSIQMIEKEMLKTDGTAFSPKRNEYCHSCHLAEDAKCPLFNKQMINNIDNPFEFMVSDIEDCQTAWKRIESNKAENSRLTKQCKIFTKGCSDPINIDDTAKLDFYVSEGLECDTEKAVTTLLEKDVDLRYIMKFMGITPSSFAALCASKNIELTEEEANDVCTRKRKTTFDAFTKEEAKKKGFINS